MPCMKILTNLPKSKIPHDLVNKILPVLAKVVNKPVHKFVCVVSSDCDVSFAGDSTSPGAVATLESIGNLGVNENRIIIKEISAFMEQELGIRPDRFFLSFYDLRPQDIGKGGIIITDEK